MEYKKMTDNKLKAGVNILKKGKIDSIAVAKALSKH
jgi:hypothetical protein